MSGALLSRSVGSRYATPLIYGGISRGPGKRRRLLFRGIKCGVSVGAILYIYMYIGYRYTYHTHLTC